MKKMNGLIYYSFSPNFGNGYFLAFDHVIGKVDMYNEQIGLEASAPDLPNIVSAFYYKETNTNLPDGLWAIFGDRQARLRYRDLANPAVELKTITFANRTEVSWINYINGIFETEFVIVKFIDDTIFMVNVAQAPSGSSNAIILQSYYFIGQPVHNGELAL